MDAVAIEHFSAGMLWLAVSLPLIVTIFFRFTRVWSLRNLDLLLMACVAVGVVVIRLEGVGSAAGNALLLSATAVLLVRLLCDHQFVRRPRIESNLTSPALAFLGIVGVAVVTCALVIVPPPRTSQQTVERGREMLKGKAPLPKKKDDVLTASGPVSTVASTPLIEISHQVTGEPEQTGDDAARVSVGILAGLGHLAVLGAILFIGVRHFNDAKLGVAMGTLYLLLPSTAVDPNSVGHILSAAWILWALALYRVSWASGIFMGLACGSLLYPAFLLPVWIAFYGRKEWFRFAAALLSVWAVLLGGLAILSPDAQNYIHESLQLIAKGVTFLVQGEAPLTWRITDGVYRVPILGTFVIMLIGLTAWPRTKRFEHLMAASAAVIVGLQFWYPQQVGEYLTGYIPLVILVAYRTRVPAHRRAEPAGPMRRTDLRHDLDKLRPDAAVNSRPSSSALRDPLVN